MAIDNICDNCDVSMGRNKKRIYKLSITLPEDEATELEHRLIDSGKWTLLYGFRSSVLYENEKLGLSIKIKAV